MTAFTLKFFPIFKGKFSSGKVTILSEVSRMLAQNLIIRPITSMTTSEGLHLVSSLHSDGLKAECSKDSNSTILRERKKREREREREYRKDVLNLYNIPFYVLN